MAFYFHILTTMHGQNHIKFETQCVCCTIRTESFNIILVTLEFKW